MARIPQRSDLSDRLVHMIKGDSYIEAFGVLMNILSERQFRGGTGYIKGGYTCVCFSEAPMSALGLLFTDSGQQRYQPFGLMVTKRWLFDRGGRPVIYQPEDEFFLLPETQRHRHVTYDPNSTDFTWEREWRIKLQTLTFTHDDVTVVLPDRRWSDRMRREHFEQQQMNAHLEGAEWMEAYPWHFFTMTDLGFALPFPTSS